MKKAPMPISKAQLETLYSAIETAVNAMPVGLSVLGDGAMMGFRTLIARVQELRDVADKIRAENFAHEAAEVTPPPSMCPRCELGVDVQSALRLALAAADDAVKEWIDRSGTYFSNTPIKIHKLADRMRDFHELDKKSADEASAKKRITLGDLGRFEIVKEPEDPWTALVLGGASRSRLGGFSVYTHQILQSMVDPLHWQPQHIERVNAILMKAGWTPAIPLNGMSAWSPPVKKDADPSSK